MAITDSQFQLNLLQEFFKAGGSIDGFDQVDPKDPRRPFLQSSISQGFERNYIGPVTVDLSRIVSNASEKARIYQQNCFEYSCVGLNPQGQVVVSRIYQETGLVTTVPGVSNICYAQWLSEAPSTFRNAYVDQKVFPQLEQPACIIDSFGKTRFVVRATQDTLGNAYVADIGYVSLIGNEFITIAPNVPFIVSQDITKLRATTIVDIPAGIKFARIKKVSRNNITEIGIVFGELTNEFYFPHNILKPNRDLSAVNQTINLENTAFNLLLMNNIDTFENKPNQLIFRGAFFSSPLSENTIIQSATTLINLINLDSNVEQYGSIPRDITTFITDYTQYNSQADPLYEQETISCFDPECFQGDCFADFVNNSLINRSISNRAIAWTIQFLSSYMIAYNAENEVLSSIEKLGQYLIRQKNRSTKLFYKGWIDTNLKLPYSEALQQDATLDCSTNCAIFMALLKLFEVTQNFQYIQEACTLYQNINKYFLTSDNLYGHTFLTKEPSVESVTYQLLLSKILNEYDHLQEMTTFFQARLQGLPQAQDEGVIVSNGDNVIISNSDDVIVTPKINLNTNIQDNNLFVPTVNDLYSSTADIFKYNYLVFSTLQSIDTNSLLSVINIIDEKQQFIYENLIKERVNTPLIFLLQKILDEQSFLDLEMSRFNSGIDIHNFKFNIEYSFTSLLQNMPTDYNWFKPEVLNKTTNLGKMLYAIAVAFAKIYTQSSFINRVSNINFMYGILLNLKAQDFDIQRFNKEPDSNLRSRIQNEISNRGNTAEAISTKMDLYDSPVTIKDNVSVILSFEEEGLTPFSDTWNQGYLQGSNFAASNIATVVFNQPIENDVFKQIQTIKPAGVKLDFVEAISFTVASDSLIPTGFKMTDVGGGCDNIDQETGSDILQENGTSRICLEDEETIIDALPPLPPPPVDPPGIVETTSDCINLRGFISSNTSAIQLRNMRLIDIVGTDDGYDVNATNDIVEPCNLFIDTPLINNALDYIQVSKQNIETEFDPSRIIYYDFFDTSTQAIRIWYDFLNNTINITKYDPTGVSAPTSAVFLTSGNVGNEFKAANLPNFVVLTSSNNITTFDKSNGTLTTLNTDVAITELAILPGPNLTLFIYSKTSTNNIVYHYSITNGGPASLTTLNTVSFTEAREHAYVLNGGSLFRYSANATDIKVHKTSVIDQPGTLIRTLPALAAGHSLSYLTAKNNVVYITSVTKNVPFATINLYINYGDYLIYKGSTTGIYQWQYIDAVNINYHQVGAPLFIGDYLLLKGSENMYNIKKGAIETVVNAICPGDTVTISSPFTLQNIDPALISNSAAVTFVDLLTPGSGSTIIGSLTKLTKECI